MTFVVVYEIIVLMVPGKLYKNIKNTEVAFKPTTIYVNHRLQIYKVKGYWFNIVNPQNIYVIDQDFIQIKI